VLERIADRPKTFVLDFSDVPFLDSTAARAIEAAIMKANRSGVRPPKVRFRNSIEDALGSVGERGNEPLTPASHAR
jgi:sulfate permease, SulP family